MYQTFYDEVRWRQEKLLREAEQERLLNSGSPEFKKTSHFYHLLAYHLGNQMELWGSRLKQFGALAQMRHQES